MTFLSVKLGPGPEKEGESLASLSGVHSPCVVPQVLEAWASVHSMRLLRQYAIRARYPVRPLFGSWVLGTAGWVRFVQTRDGCRSEYDDAAGVASKTTREASRISLGFGGSDAIGKTTLNIPRQGSTRWILKVGG